MSRREPSRALWVCLRCGDYTADCRCEDGPLYDSDDAEARYDAQGNEVEA